MRDTWVGATYGRPVRDGASLDMLTARLPSDLVIGYDIDVIASECTADYIQGPNDNDGSKKVQRRARDRMARAKKREELAVQRREREAAKQIRWQRWADDLVASRLANGKSVMVHSDAWWDWLEQAYGWEG